MQARERGLLAVACALVAAIALGVPASAWATPRFASPTGMNTGTCTTVVTACNLQRAVEVVAVDGDEVRVLPGTYAEGTNDLMVTGSKHVHGLTGLAVPSITFTSPAGQGVLLSGSSLLERLAISTDSSPTDPASLRLTGGTAQQITVRQDDPGNEACLVEGNSVLRDSVCWANAANGIGLTALASAQSFAATLRNLTIEGTVGPARGLLATADTAGSLQLDVKNVIARGTAAADVEASALDPASNVTVTLERSNYATESEIAGGGPESITNPGTNSNQTATPALVDRAAGNFHQQPSSPTVDAGMGFLLIGSLDLDGEPRSVEGTAGCIAGIARPDIGADELIPAVRDCVAPETGIVRGPKRKTSKRRANFEFDSTEAGSFQCSIDEKPFVACTTPRLYRKLRKGKHVFNVRAVDLAGNLDASPAVRVWNIRAKRKKRHRRPGK